MQLSNKMPITSYHIPQEPIVKKHMRRLDVCARYVECVGVDVDVEGYNMRRRYESVSLI